MHKNDIESRVAPPIQTHMLFGARAVARKSLQMAWPFTMSEPYSSARPDEIATTEVDKVKDKSIKRDIPFALRRGTIGPVATALDAAHCALVRRGRGAHPKRGGLGWLDNIFFLPRSAKTL